MGESPSCGVIFEKSTVRTSTRAGVPVLKRRMEKPLSSSDCVRPVAAMSPCGPPSHEHWPMMMRLFRYTPVHSTAARQPILEPVAVSTPRISPFSTISRRTSPCRSVSPG